VKRSSLIIVLTLFSLLVSCGPRRIKTTILMPARSSAAAKVRRVAVWPFEGSWYTRAGTGLGARIEAMLTNIKVNGEKYFTVVDRQNLNRILQEQEISLSAAADPTTAVRIGKVTGIQALLTGTILEASVRDEPYVVKSRKCVSTNKKGLCTRFREVRHRCIKRTAVLSFVSKLVDVTTGNVLFSETLTRRTQDSGCPSRGETLLGEADMFRGITESALEELAKWLAPYPAVVRLKLKNADRVVRNIDEVLVKFKAAVKFSDKRRIDRACELWAECYEITRDDSLSVLFNMGVCREVSGDFAEALEFYTRADKASLEPDDTITEALERIGKLLDKKDELDSQLNEGEH